MGCAQSSQAASATQPTSTAARDPTKPAAAVNDVGDGIAPESSNISSLVDHRSQDNVVGATLDHNNNVNGDQSILVVSSSMRESSLVAAAVAAEPECSETIDPLLDTAGAAVGTATNTSASATTTLSDGQSVLVVAGAGAGDENETSMARSATSVSHVDLDASTATKSKSGASSNNNDASRDVRSTTSSFVTTTTIEQQQQKQHNHETTVLSNGNSSAFSGQSIILYDDDRFRCGINGRNGYELEEIYEEPSEQSQSPMLGRGQYGYVYRRSHLFQEDTNVAVKRTKPTLLDLRAGAIETYDDVEEKCQEVRTLLRLRGPHCQHHVMQLYEFFWNGTDLNLVLELLPLNLREWMLQQRSFPEEQAKEAARSILSGLKVMGEKNIVHRDIKEENIMFGVVDDLRTLKICDFGFAQDLSNLHGSRGAGSRISLAPHMTTGICGSLGYLAPEIYSNAPYGTSVDLFSFGVLLFRILSAEKPWPDTPRIATQLATLQLQYNMSSARWQPVSSHGKGLVRRLLTYHTDRATASQALRHEWFGEQSMSILVTDPAFLNTNRRNNSGTIILEDPLDRDGNDSVDVPCYWIHENMHQAVVRLVESASFHGYVKKREDGYMLIEEKVIADRHILLPRAVARFRSYTELECRNLFRKIALHVGKFHTAGLAHRCLHTESIVVAVGSRDHELSVHLRGINYAQLSSPDRPITGRVGDSDKAFEWFAFKAPEIDTSFTHDERVDLWSLGVLLYTLLCGVGPFYGERRDIFSKKSQGVILYEIVEPSEKARSLVRGLIQVDPSRRLRIEEILNHAWMTAPDAELKACSLGISQDTFRDWYQSQR